MAKRKRYTHRHLFHSFVWWVALGCSDGVTSIGDNDSAGSDAAVHDVDVSADLGVVDAASIELEVRFGKRHVTIDGDLFVPDDVAGIRVEVSSLEGEEAIVGRSIANGLIVVAGAPPGVRRMLVERPGMSPELLVGTSTSVEMVSAVLGRAGVGPTNTTTLDITVELASPWTETDSFELRSPGTGFQGGTAFGMVAAGATTVTGVGGRWPDDRPLARGAPDDDLYLFRFGYQRLQDRERFALTELGQVEDLRLSDGAAHSLTATLLPAGVGLAVDVTWDQSNLLPLGPLDPMPNGVPATLDAVVWTVGADRHGLFGGGVNVVLDLADGQPLRTTRVVTTAPPLGWGAHLASSLSLNVALPLPAGGVLAASVGALRSLPVEEVPANRRVPIVLKWPIGLSIDGVPSWQLEKLRDVSSTPVLRWTAPDLGAVRSYTVFLHEVEVSGLPHATTVGTIYTDQREVRIPSGWLRAGGLYFFQVVASDAVEFDRTPYRFATRESRASMVSNVFSIAP